MTDKLYMVFFFLNGLTREFVCVFFHIYLFPCETTDHHGSCSPTPHTYRTNVTDKVARKGRRWEGEYGQMAAGHGRVFTTITINYVYTRIRANLNFNSVYVLYCNISNIAFKLN